MVVSWLFSSVSESEQQQQHEQLCTTEKQQLQLCTTEKTISMEGLELPLAQFDSLQQAHLGSLELSPPAQLDSFQRTQLRFVGRDIFVIRFVSHWSIMGTGTVGRMYFYVDA